jgi:hypothetical protein
MSISSIPMDIVKNTLGYDNRFVIRGTEIIQINKINKSDERYAMLKRIPKVIGGAMFRDYWLQIPIAGTNREYCMNYLWDSHKNYFYGAILDYDEIIPGDDEDDEMEPSKYSIYGFSTLKIPRTRIN